MGGETRPVTWSITISPEAEKQAKKLGPSAEREIARYLRQRIAKAENPRHFGKPLSSNLAGLWRYRIGDYRLICEIQDEKLVVLVIKIGHRRDVYR